MQTLDSDIIRAGLDAEKEAYNLVLQALSAPTTHEKDKIIETIQEYWNVHEEASNLLNGCKQSLSEQLSAFQLKLQKISTEYNTKIRNTSFLSQLKKFPEKRTREDYISLITDIENQISKSGTLANPTHLQKLLSIPESEDPFHLKLRDLLYKRLEQLTYSLKKRTFTVDESEDISSSISEEFGSVNGLVSTYSDLIIQNQQLKSEESLLLNDKIVKRRDLVSISPTFLANLGLALQNELRTQLAVGAAQIIPSDTSGDFKSFDELQPNSGDITYEIPEFSTTINPETVKSLIKARGANNQLEALKKVMEEQQKTIDKLTRELEPLRFSHYSKNENSQTREDRLLSMHDKFSAQICELTEKIEANSSIVQAKYSQLLNMISERNVLGIQFGQWLHIYKSLINEHIFLSKLAKNNDIITDTLASISYFYDLLLLSNTRENPSTEYDEMKKYFLEKLQPSIIECHQQALLMEELSKKQMESQKNSDDENSIPSLNSLMKLQMQGNPRNRKRRLMGNTVQETREQSNDPSENEFSDHSEDTPIDSVSEKFKFSRDSSSLSEHHDKSQKSLEVSDKNEQENTEKTDQTEQNDKTNNKHDNPRSGRNSQFKFDKTEKSEKKKIKKDKSTIAVPKIEAVDEKKEMNNPILNATPSQLLNYLSLAFDIQTKKTHFHQAISGHLHYQLRELQEGLKTELDLFNKDIHDSISLFQKASHRILFKEMKDVNTEFNHIPKVDNEGQTIEEELNPKKAKGKKPAKPQKKK